jgi:hypothetical protein
VSGEARVPALPASDFAFFGGVLEYVNDLRRLVSYLRDRIIVVVASCAVARAGSSLRTRRATGWVTDDSQGQTLFRLVRRSGTPA